MKKIAILYSEHSPLVDAMTNRLKDFDVQLFNKISDELAEFDLTIGIGIEKGFQGLACHYSLLPAFDGEYPVKQAVLAGVKVTGITIYQTEPYKIIAQYPLVITHSSHFDDIETQLAYLEQVIYPLVAEKFVQGEPFEIQTLLNKASCKGNCQTCGGCK